LIDAPTLRGMSAQNGAPKRTKAIVPKRKGLYLMTMQATYSPDDNKLRLYSVERLDSETYARVKAAGFSWAPKQQLFVAPAWTPSREDLLIELCGYIGDEDTSLGDRAEQRAERFDEYSDKRLADAESARNAVAAIADGIPMGQPILVGHHSERRARKDAERIESGMRKAVKMWRTSQYWEARAAGAIRHAKYKELPGVRHRRIKTIEADKRKRERERTEAQKWLKLWVMPGLTLEQARKIANYCWLSVVKHPTLDQWRTAYDVLRSDPPEWSIDQVQEVAARTYPKTIEYCNRWIEHCENRLSYERAMLADQIGTEPGTADAMGSRFDLQPGGQVLTGRSDDEWLTVLRVNRSNGIVNSVTTTAPRSMSWCAKTKCGVEKIRDYRAPTPDDKAAVKKAGSVAPLCNYPGDGFEHMTKADYDKKHKDYKCTRVVKATETAGLHRVRHAMLPGYKTAHVYLIDAKRVDPPAPVPPTEPKDVAEFVREFAVPPADRSAPVTADSASPAATADFEAMAATLRRGGVQVVTAPQLFPTPAELAREVVSIAGVMPGERVLEPSAGTGAILHSVFGAFTQADCGRVVAVEINPRLAEGLRGDRQRRLYANESNFDIRCTDFLECSEAELGTFHRVVMNPPFVNGADIKHIEHARKFLKPGGRLVAICADGPRQRAQLLPLATTWRALPAGTFKESGTMVNAALLVIDAPPG
jgi:precorrin-6B methylase 2